MPYKNKENREEYHKKYYQKHRQKILTRAKKYQKKNSEHIKKYKRKYRRRNLEREKEWGKRYREKHKNRITNAHMKRNYGITLAEYDKLFEKQKGICKICGGINISGRRLYIDHDHKTGKIRGLLCASCNCCLGWYEIRKKEISRYLKLGL